MKKIPMAVVVVLLFANVLSAQSPDVKFIADTLVVQADGKFEADPDLATLTFSVFAQDKNLKQTYDQASQSMKKIADVAEKNGLKKGRCHFWRPHRATLLRRRKEEAGKVL